MPTVAATEISGSLTFQHSLPKNRKSLKSKLKPGKDAEGGYLGCGSTLCYLGRDRCESKNLTCNECGELEHHTDRCQDYHKYQSNSFQGENHNVKPEVYQISTIRVE